MARNKAHTFVATCCRGRKPHSRKPQPFCEALTVIEGIEDLPDGPVFDGAVLGLCYLEDAFARSR